MTFVTAGLAIAGLCAVAIPILIHLLSRRRRKPIEWAAMRFLIEAFRRHKRRLQLEQLLLLAIRCLILALLGIALARPILEGVGAIAPGGSRAVYLVIDDGMASGLTGEDAKTALSRHAARAAELVRSLAPGDAVGVISAARPAKGLLVPPSTDHSAVIDLIQSLEPKESPTDFPGAFSFVRQAVDEAKKGRQQTLVYLMSDFRHGSAALDSPLPQTTAGDTDDIRLLASPPDQEPLTNVQVTSIEPVRSLLLPGSDDGSGQVTVRLRRSGGQLAGDVTKVRLVGENLPQLEPQIVSWQPGETQAAVEFMVNYGTAADREAGLSAVIDNDALAADNQRHTVLELRSQLRVLLIDRRSFGFERTLDQLTAGQWIRRALEPLENSPIQLVESEPAALDLADVRTADAAILPRPDLLSAGGWSVLRQFIENGGLLILMPPGEVNVHQWTERLSSDLHLPWRLPLEVVEPESGWTLAQEQPRSELLRMVSSDLDDLARPILIHRMLPLDAETVSAGLVQPLLQLHDGSPLVVLGAPVKPANGESAQQPQRAVQGLVIYMAAAPELGWTNLPTQPLMVPLFHEMVRQGLSVIRASQKVTVGEQPNLALGASARDLVGPGEQQRIALDAAGKPQAPLEHGGLYGVLDQTGQPLGTLAVNVDAAAGATDVQSAAAVSSWLDQSGPWMTFEPAEIASTLGGSVSGSPIAGLLLIVVLALIALETALARWFSHADRRLDASSLSFEHGASLRSFGSSASNPKPQAAGLA